MKELYSKKIKSPVGMLTLIAHDEALVAVLWEAEKLGRVKLVHSPVKSHPILDETARQLAEYFQGERVSFGIRLEFHGTTFQKKVWAGLQAIPYGSTAAYSTLAAKIGLPLACRAVGSANGKNPLSIIVPCHRVIGKDGRLTGFAGGLKNKSYLVQLETRFKLVELANLLYKKGVLKRNLKSTGKGLLLAILYLLSGLLSARIHQISGQFPLVWFPTGLGVAAIVLFGTQLLPYVFFGSVALNFILGYSPLFSIGVSIGAILQTWLSAWLYAKVCDSAPSLTKVKEVVGYGVLVLGVSSFVAATFQSAVFYFQSSMSFDDVYSIWRSRWLGQAMSSLVIAAPCICWWNDIRYRVGRVLKLGWEAALLLTLIVATCIFLYTPLANYNHSLIVRPFLMFSLMIWAAVRFDVLGVTTTVIVLASTTIYGNIFGFTAASTAPPGERLILQQYFTMALGFTGLVISAAIREKAAALEARSEFLSIASHELKTPIAALSLQLQVAERKLRNKPNRAEHEVEQLVFLEKTGLQISRLVQIVEQLLDVSKIDRKIVSLQFEKINLSSFIRNLIERLDSNLKQAGSTVSLQLQSDIYCNWDSVRFEQVFENLISNATKYASGRPIQIEAKESDGVVELAVRDSGPGIEMSKQAHIFDRFIRANSSPQIKGLGLGLFITRQIVEAHGGKIWVESKLGQGTSFLMKIPAHPSVVETKSAT